MSSVAPPAPVAVQNDSDFEVSGRYIVYSQAPLQASAVQSSRRATQSSGAQKFDSPGEQQNAAVDAWGVNIYRGRTFTNLFQQIRSYTKKPVMLTEYGASAAYHPKSGSTYTYEKGPDGLGVCKQGSGSTSITDVAELPQSGNPNMAGLIDLVQNTTKLLYSGYQIDGVDSGGSYFEWTDEWWKANGGDPSVHYGNVAYNGHFLGLTRTGAGTV